MDMSSKT